MPFRVEELLESWFEEEDWETVDLGRVTAWRELTECVDIEEAGREGGLDWGAAGALTTRISRYFLIVGVIGEVKLGKVFVIHQSLYRTLYGTRLTYQLDSAGEFCRHRRFFGQSSVHLR